ncbi:hypothetical protein, partial [Chitinimonas sp.]|uniref:hypothetical protein n=1 Tax=Chitinimonas sp. TaxID=1934313 RepID=UPI0035B28F90
LKSHGYLLEILVSMVNKAEAKAETRTEQIRQSGGYSARQGGGLQALTAVSEAMISHRQGGPPDSDACQRVSGSQASPSSKPVKREIPAHARKALGLDKPKSEVETDGSNE